MTIAIDIDEVLADFLSDYLSFHNQKYNTTLKKEDFHKFFHPEIFNLTPDNLLMDIQEYINSGRNELLPTIAGSQEGVRVLKADHQLVAITGRSTVQAQTTRDWLDKNYPGCFDNVFFVRDQPLGKVIKPKKQLCLEAGAKILIDDELNNGHGCSESGIAVLLFDNPWNQLPTMPANMVRVHSWNEIVDKILNKSE